MTFPKQFLLSDLLKHRVRCDKGIDHGNGLIAWMHPPVHRLLGWSSRPSTLQLSRHIWKLNQIRGIGNYEVFVKGFPSIAEQSTLDRLPTLLNSNIYNLNGERIASIADLNFEPKTGKIFYYLLSRTDPRIPGTSRWRLLIERIIDQQPGMVSIDAQNLDDLPLERSSIRQNILKSSRNIREQIQEFSDQAGSKLEGWLEEPPWEETGNRILRSKPSLNLDSIEDWNNNFDNQFSNNHLESFEERPSSKTPLKSVDDEDDPWI